jgi:Holliday junction resolvase-like predicted endonuclease
VYGGAIAAITPKKLRQMYFAATLYSSRDRIAYSDTLAVITIDGAGQLSFLEVE